MNIVCQMHNALSSALLNSEIIALRCAACRMKKVTDPGGGGVFFTLYDFDTMEILL